MTRKVLVVEDNELNLKLFCDLLRVHGFIAEPVRDGREAVARAREVQPDLIIMDIQMPHVTGYELILELKADEELRRIPVMAVTAYAGRDDEDRIPRGGSGFVRVQADQPDALHGGGERVGVRGVSLPSVRLAPHRPFAAPPHLRSH